MQTPDYIPERRAADLLGTSLRTLRKRRYAGVGPRYVKHGKFVMYSMRDLERYLEAHRVTPVREASIYDEAAIARTGA